MSAIDFEYNGQVFRHTAHPWRSLTNRHPNTDGSLWGWIEGAPGNVTWSNKQYSRFTDSDASEVVRLHNEWLETQTPPAVRITKLVPTRERLAADLDGLHRRAAEIERQIATVDAEIRKAEAAAPALPGAEGGGER